MVSRLALPLGYRNRWCHCHCWGCCFGAGFSHHIGVFTGSAIAQDQEYNHSTQCDKESDIPNIAGRLRVISGRRFALTVPVLGIGFQIQFSAANQQRFADSLSLVPHTGHSFVFEVFRIRAHHNSGIVYLMLGKLGNNQKRIGQSQSAPKRFLQ